MVTFHSSYRNDDQSVQCPCILSQSGGIAASGEASAEQRGQTVRPGVSLSSAVRNHKVPPLTDWSPACGAAFSLDDLHATSRRSSGRRFITAEHLLVRRCSGVRINTQRATSQTAALQASGRLWSSWPGEQNTARCQILSPIVAASGGADRGLEVTQLTINAYTWSFEHADRNILAFTWCTQSPEVPANLLHNGGQVPHNRSRANSATWS